MRWFAMWVTLAAALMACREPEQTKPPPPAAPATTMEQVAAGSASAATGAPSGKPRCSPPPAQRRAWRHSVSTSFAVEQGDPHHGAIDAVVNPGAAARLRAKYAYGKLSKDLEDERVEAFIAAGPIAAGGCPSWKRAGVVLTDDDGYATFSIDGKKLSATGRYPFELVVEGDMSRARGAVWVVDKKHKTVVFDIDGTLTEGDEAIVEQVLSGVSPPARSGSAVVAKRHADSGYLIVYITGRPSTLATLSRKWLRERHFPPGPVLTTETLTQSKPTVEGVQRFKRDTLAALQKGPGVDIQRAYGNATTDICAYAQVGLPPDKTFIVGPHGGKACADGKPTQAIRSYDEHLKGLKL